MPLRLFVLKEDPVIRYRLSESVAESDDMVIVGDGAWTEETLAHLPTAQPDFCSLNSLKKANSQNKSRRCGAPALRPKPNCSQSRAVRVCLKH